jgi:hypothetical protein
MAFLNRQEREQLLKELVEIGKFNKAKGKLLRMDPKGRLAYFRNAQASGRFYTRFELEGLGTRVTLVEQQVPKPGKSDAYIKSEFELVEVHVEPTPENRI